MIVILLMLAISTMKTHREKWQAALSNLGWNFAPRPDSRGRLSTRMTPAA